MAVNDGGVPPILAQKHYTLPPAFTIAIAAERLLSRFLR